MACVQLLFIRGGRLLGRENYFVQHDGDSQETIMTDFIKQYYGDTNFIPKELLLPMDSTDRDLLKEWFTQLKGQNVDVSVPQRGYKTVSYTHLDVYKRQGYRGRSKANADYCS